MSVLSRSNSIFSFSLLHDFTRLGAIFVFMKIFLGKPFLFYNSWKQDNTTYWKDICLEVAYASANFYVEFLAFNQNVLISHDAWVITCDVSVSDLEN